MKKRNLSSRSFSSQARLFADIIPEGADPSEVNDIVEDVVEEKVTEAVEDAIDSVEETSLQSKFKRLISKSIKSKYYADVAENPDAEEVEISLDVDNLADEVVEEVADEIADSTDVTVQSKLHSKIKRELMKRFADLETETPEDEITEGEKQEIIDEVVEEVKEDLGDAETVTQSRIRRKVSRYVTRHFTDIPEEVKEEIIDEAVEEVKEELDVPETVTQSRFSRRAPKNKIFSRVRNKRRFYSDELSETASTALDEGTADDDQVISIQQIREEEVEDEIPVDHTIVEETNLQTAQVALDDDTIVNIQKDVEDSVANTTDTEESVLELVDAAGDTDEAPSTQSLEDAIDNII